MWIWWLCHTFIKISSRLVNTGLVTEFDSFQGDVVYEKFWKNMGIRCAITGDWTWMIKKSSSRVVKINYWQMCLQTLSELASRGLMSTLIRQKHDFKFSTSYHAAVVRTPIFVGFGWSGSICWRWCVSWWFVSRGVLRLSVVECYCKWLESLDNWTMSWWMCGSF